MLCAIFFVVVAGIILFLVFRLRPELVEDVYRPVSRFLLYQISYAVSPVSFSVAEVFLFIALLCIFVAILRLLYVLITGPRRIKYLLLFILRGVLIAAISGLLFYTLWGVNYNAEPLSATLGLDVKEREAGELAAMNEYLCKKANFYSLQIKRDGDGNPAERDFSELSHKVALRFSEFTGRNEVPVKYLLLSEHISYMQISGIFIPYTGEANVNKNNVLSDLPFCMAHEMAHRYAIAPEDEANFFSFYILEGSDDPFLAYSAYLAAIRYCQNALYQANYDEFARIYGLYNEYVRRDLLQYNNHWDKYSGKLADISHNVNDVYLMLQGESEGVKSYSEMVDYMLAWFDKMNVE